MKYVLKNKDKVVLEFEVILAQHLDMFGKEQIKNLKICDKRLIPHNLNTNDIQANLLKWIDKRKAPKSRKYIKKIISTYKSETSKENIMDYVNVSFALSLNDSYWITPADKNYEWKNYNLYDNNFKESLELAAFGLVSQKVNGFTSSPEYTSSGMLPKCWHRDDGKIYLYKGSSKMYDNEEIYSEYYMTQIAQAMNFDCVPYDLKEFHGKIVSTCPIFTNENEGYMPIGYYIEPKIREEKGFTLINEIEKIYGKEKLADIMVFDSIICNIDRHLGNFGMIVDNNTNEILRSAPIFDNGLSMMTTLDKDDINKNKEFLGFEESALKISFNQQMKFFAKLHHISSLEKLKSFEFKKHKDFNLPDSWLEPIQNTIKDRANMALEFAYQKDKKLQISKTRDIAKNKTKQPKSKENGGYER